MFKFWFVKTVMHMLYIFIYLYYINQYYQITDFATPKIQFTAMPFCGTFDQIVLDVKREHPLSLGHISRVSSCMNVSEYVCE